MASAVEPKDALAPYVDDAGIYVTRARILYMVYALALAVEVGSTDAPYPVLRNPDAQELKQPDGRSEVCLP